MHWLTMVCVLVLFGMIYGIGHLVWKLWQRQDAAERDHDQTREVAEAAASDAAACAAVIDRLERPRRRRLHAVQDKTRGVSTWTME